MNGFSNSTYENATLQVPLGAKGNYIVNADWNRFKNIEEADFSGIENNILGLPETVPVGYFSIDGRRVSPEAKGPVIVVYSDGTTKRVMNN